MYQNHGLLTKFHVDSRTDVPNETPLSALGADLPIMC